MVTQTRPLGHTASSGWRGNGTGVLTFGKYSFRQPPCAAEGDWPSSTRCSTRTITSELLGKWWTTPKESKMSPIRRCRSMLGHRLGAGNSLNPHHSIPPVSLSPPNCISPEGSNVSFETRDQLLKPISHAASKHDANSARNIIMPRPSKTRRSGDTMGNSFPFDVRPALPRAPLSVKHVFRTLGQLASLQWPTQESTDMGPHRRVK